WCGPCKRLAPTVDAVAADYAGKITVGKLNVDDNPNTAFRFQVRGIPTLLLFKGGQVVESVVGLVQKDDLKKVLDKHVSRCPHATSSSSGRGPRGSPRRYTRRVRTCVRWSSKASRPVAS